MPMDCGHNASKLADCKISCCKTADETVVNVAQFVIPAPQSLDSLDVAAPIGLQRAPQMLSRSEKPQSPPPRTNFS